MSLFCIITVIMTVVVIIYTAKEVSPLVVLTITSLFSLAFL